MKTPSPPKDSTLSNSKSIKNRTRGSLDIRNHVPNIPGRKPARLQGCQLFLHLHRFFCARPLYWHSEKSPFILNNRTRPFFRKHRARGRRWMRWFQPASIIHSTLLLSICYRSWFFHSGVFNIPDSSGDMSVSIGFESWCARKNVALCTSMIVLKSDGSFEKKKLLKSSELNICFQQHIWCLSVKKRIKHCSTLTFQSPLILRWKYYFSFTALIHYTSCKLLVK